MCVNNNAVINNYYASFQDFIFALQKFPWARQRISWKFINYFGSRPQKKVHWSGGVLFGISE